MTSRAYIESRCKRYLHRDDFTPEDFTESIAIATRELGQMLRCPENEVELVIPAGTLTDPFPLPTDLRKIREVERDAVNGPQSLQAVPRSFMNKFAVTGGLPAFYLVLDGSLYLRPFGSPELRVWYYQEPAAITVDPASTNPVLTAYPELYVWRTLAELAAITQDVELVSGYRDTFGARVDEINLQARNAQYSQPAMRGV